MHCSFFFLVKGVLFFGPIFRLFIAEVLSAPVFPTAAFQAVVQESPLLEFSGYGPFLSQEF